VAVFCLVFAIGMEGQKPDQESEVRLKGLSLEELGNIEVTTVSKGPVKITRTPAAVYVITQDVIRRSGITSFPEVLRLAPGVEVARIDSVKWAIGIRGFSSRLSRAVLVMIDGRTVYSPLFHGVYWEVQDTMLEDIDRIEVIRGPGGTIWVANAVNGVINIITKSSKETQGALVSAGGGNVNQGFLSARYGGGNNRNFSYRIYGKGFTRGPEFHSDNRQFDDWRRSQGGFRTDWDVTNRDTFTIQGDMYRGVAGESTRVTLQSPPSAAIIDENAELSGGNLLARWRRVLSGGSDFQLQAYYDRASRRQANQAEFRDTFDVDFVHHLLLPHQQDFIWGFGARISLGKLPPVVPTYIFTPSRRTDQLYTGFIQDEIPLVRESVWLTIGSKLLHSSFAGFDIEPTARLLWTPSTRQTVWTAVTRAVRTPSDIEDTLQSTSLRTTNPLAFNRVMGDGQFTTETMLGYEAGYRHLVNPRFSIDVAAFYNNYDNLLSIEPGDPFTENSSTLSYLVYPFSNRNGVQGTTQGIEIIPNLKPATWWRLEGSYAYLNVNLKTSPRSQDVSTVNSIQGSNPRHQVVIQSYFDLPRKVEFSQVYRYISALPWQQVQSYSTADMRLAWRPVPQIEFSVVGQNLFQPYHFEYSGNPGALVGVKRSFYAGLTWRQ